MKSNVLTYYFLISVSLTSCFPSYNAYPKAYRNAKANFPQKKAFVINKELKQEYAVLKNSGIYELVDDSTAAVKIKLHQMVPDRSFHCGNTMTGSMITFGLLPSVDSYNNTYSYDVTENNSFKNYQYKLEVNQSLWLFNLFRLGKTYNKQAGKALLGNYMASSK